MKIITLALLAALTACTSDSTGTAEHMTPVEMCGQPPLSPPFSVAYGSDGIAKLPDAEMEAIEQFMRTDNFNWQNCILSITN